MKYVIIEEEILYDKKLKNNEKIVLAIIKAIEQNEKKVYATNKFFSKILNISEREISRIIKKLKEKKYINIKIKSKKRIINSTTSILTKERENLYEKAQEIFENLEEEYNWLEDKSV